MKVTTQILKREIDRHGLKYNTIGNAIIDDNPYLKAAKSKMVRVEPTPDLVTTSQKDQMNTTDIPANKPRKYELFNFTQYYQNLILCLIA